MIFEFIKDSQELTLLLLHVFLTLPITSFLQDIFNPSIIKIISEIIIAGTVVSDKYLIWEIRSLPAIACNWKNC